MRISSDIHAAFTADEKKPVEIMFIVLILNHASIRSGHIADPERPVRLQGQYIFKLVCERYTERRVSHGYADQRNGEVQ